MDETALANLFHQLKETDIEDYDREGYEALETDDARLAYLKDLGDSLQGAVDTKERAIADLESEVDTLKTVETAQLEVMHRVRLRLGIDAVEGQLPLPTATT